MQSITTSSYGLYILSADSFISFLKKEKIKSKKVVSYLQKNHEIYIKSIQLGVWLPILPIDSIKYVVKVKNLNQSFSTGWEEVVNEKGFNLEIGKDNCFWVGDIGSINDWNPKEYSAKETIYYKTLDDVTIYSDMCFHLNQGKYLVDIIGYKRKQELDYPESNYGYLLNLTEVKEFESYKDPREDEKYSFNVSS